MNRTRPKQIVIRATEEEYNRIKKKVAKSKLKQNEYLLRSALDKDIVIVEGVKDLTMELKKIGNNINQLTRSVHQGKVNCEEELKLINQEMKELWQLSRSLIRGRV